MHRLVSLALAVLAVLLAAGPARAQSPVETVGDASASAAWRALEARRYADAQELFERAVAVAPRDAALIFGAGVSVLMQGKNDEARRWFQAALSLSPQMTEASVLLGRAYYRDGQLSEAVAAYEAALQLAPSDPDLIGGLEQWRPELDAQARLSQAQGAHFTVLFDGPADDRAAQQALRVLEDAYWRLGQELSIYVSRPITVILYTKQRFRDTTRTPEWAVGVYDGRIKVPVEGADGNSEHLRRVLEHELVHALVAIAAGPMVPGWLNEGLATVLEPGGVDWAEGQLAAPGSVRIPFSRLSQGFRGLTAAQATTAYAQSTVAVKAMVDNHGMAAVVRLLEAVGRGVPFAEAFHQSLSVPLEEWVSRIDRP